MSDERWTEEEMNLAKLWMRSNAAHARLAAEAYAADAKMAEPLDPDAAKRMKEAAHYYVVVAACLDGTRTFATDAELAETRAKYGAKEEVDRG